MKTNYEIQADKFLSKTNSTLSVEFLKNDFHFVGDKEKRDIYKCTLKRGSRKYSFNFGNSLNDSGFYFTVGRSKHELDRKYLDSKNLVFVCKSINSGFTPSCKADVIHKPVAPNSYAILCCLTKYDPCTFSDFCSEYGYDEDSRTAKKIYKAVKKEYSSLASMYSDDELELMSEIQ